VSDRRDMVPRGQLDLDAVENEEPITALVRRLERAGLIDEVSLQTGDLQDLSLDQTESLLRFFATLHRGSAWWVGDLYRFAEDRWNEEASQLANATSLSISTITRYTTLAREFPPRERVAGLGISHHRLVVKFDPGARRAWLDRALAGDGPGEGPWTVHRLHEELQLAGLARTRDTNPEPAETSGVLRDAPIARIEQSLLDLPSERRKETAAVDHEAEEAPIDLSATTEALRLDSLHDLVAEIVAMERDERGRVCIGSNLLERLQVALEAN